MSYVYINPEYWAERPDDDGIPFIIPYKSHLVKEDFGREVQLGIYFFQLQILFFLQKIQMENELTTEQEIPSGMITSINFNILNRLLTEEVSVTKISISKELTSSDPGLPNYDSECRTCNAKEKDECEGHFGHIDLPFTILHPYFLPEVAYILTKICPGCRSVRSDKVKDVESTSELSQNSSCRYCDVNWRDVYPMMKFKVSSKDLHGKMAIIAEAKENMSSRAQNRGGMTKDYWDIIPVDSQQDDRSSMTNTRVLSHTQVHHMKEL